MANEYTVVTPQGDVHLTTPHHHTAFANVEDFLKAHDQTISKALGVASIAIQGLGLYLMHGRAGKRLK